MNAPSPAGPRTAAIQVGLVRGLDPSLAFVREVDAIPDHQLPHPAHGRIRDHHRRDAVHEALAEDSLTLDPDLRL